VQEEHRRARALHLQARVTHDLRIGIDLGGLDLADPRAGQATRETALSFQYSSLRRGARPAVEKVSS
jgi:hypothetical protein